MSTIETYTGKTAGDARGSSSSWSELMKELWESAGRAPVEGDDIGTPEVREAIGLARAVTLPDGQVWTAANGVNLWREGPAAGLVKHWEKGTSAEGGLLGRVFRGELENSGRIQDTLAKNGAPKEWSQLRFTFDPRELAALAGSDDREAIAEAARDLARTIHGALHEGPRGGTRMVVSGPVHLDTATPHVDFYLHHFEVDAQRGDVLGQVNLSKTSELRDEVLRIRNAVRDRHGFDFEGFKANNRLVDLPWDMPRSRAEREAIDAAPEGAPEGIEGEVEAPAARPVATVPAPAFRRPIAEPELIAVQQYRKTAAREADQARKVLEEAEARERFAEHVESAFLAAEEAKSERDVAMERAETAEADRDAAIERATTAEAERDQAREEAVAVAEELASERETHSLTSQHLEQAEGRVKRLEADLSEAKAKAAETNMLLDEVRQNAVAGAVEIDRLGSELAGLTGELESVTAERDQAREEVATLTADRDRLTGELTATTMRAETAEQANDSLAERAMTVEAELATIRQTLAAAQAEAERAKGEAREATAERAGLASSLDAVKIALATSEGALASLKEAAAEAEEADAVPPGGAGLDGVAIDRRRRDPSASWPRGVTYKRLLFGRARIEVGETTLRVQRGAVRLAAGTMTPAAIDAMVVHAKREGWSPIAVNGDERTREALTKAARAAGLVLEGDEASIEATASATPTARAPAPAPSFQAKAPTAWTAADRREAEQAFEAAKKRNPNLSGATIEEWGARVHAQWEKKNQRPEADGPPSTLPKP